MTTMTDYRNWQRFKLRAPVRAEILDSPDAGRVVTGTTRDISAAGAFVMCDNPPPQSVRINVSVKLESVGQTLTMSGFVTRTEPNGFAVNFDETLAAFGG